MLLSNVKTTRANCIIYRTSGTPNLYYLHKMALVRIGAALT